MIKKLLLNTLLVTGLGFATLSVSAQSPMENKATFYAEEIAKEFSVDEEIKTQLYEIKLAQLDANREMSKKKREGGYESDEAFKEARRASNQAATKKILELLDIKPKDFREPNKRILQEMKEVQ